MGLFGKIRDLFHGDKIEIETIKARSNMDEQNSTLIFNGMPDYTSVVGVDYSGNGTPVNPQIINRMAEDDAKRNEQINRQLGLPTASQPPRGMGVGVNNMANQVPPGAPVNYNQPAQPYNQYPQQPQYQQQPAGQPIPIQNSAPPPPPPPQNAFAYLQEPFSELLQTDDECHVIVDLPGIKKENVDIRLTDNNEVAITFTRTTFVDQKSAEPKGAKKGQKRSSKNKTKWLSQVNIPDYLLGKHTVVYKIMRPVDENNIKCSFEYGQVHVILGFRAPIEGKPISIG